ncbi:hypothetical protein F3Y22_tig00005974pilonHSYRG00335 [Hibiscus syriacus]|uniref:RNase H type-1 domain-containing protein n=1 Tax=Hibiscus syriacus TaxID=106335 RepID=A0A6A3CHU7_HIBSY|nr:hypothetical protein F3Y22_tig00005974pilonHSYRG00335 [Hibiscus syriacus]
MSLRSIGGVLRMSVGVWLNGFHKFLGISSPLMAELWGIYFGLTTTWNYGIESLRIPSDSHQAIQLLLDPNIDYTMLPPVLAINLMYVVAGILSFCVPREKNMVVDGIAKLNLPRDYLM